MQNTSHTFSIKNYLDIQPIYDKLNHLVSKDVVALPEKELQKALDYFKTNCSNSKALANQAKEYIPGGVQHNLAFNYPYPIVFNKAEGAYLYDIDNNKYIDFFTSWRPNCFRIKSGSYSQ